MRKKIVYIFTFFLFVLLILARTLYVETERVYKEEKIRNYVVDLNEIEQLSKSEDANDKKIMEEKLNELSVKLKDSNGGLSLGLVKKWIFYVCGFCILFLILTMGYIYIKMIRPFEKLEKYTGEIARGNLDVPLNYERINYFGQFTWAFDHMRNEITKARECEKLAIENNKTVIATLSHDIKTPIASIRAYSEALVANLDSSIERRQRYVSVILKKCDEVTKLTNDLFLHSLTDLNKLVISKTKTDISEVINNIVRELTVDKDNIHLHNSLSQVFVELDEKRFKQVIGNLVNNARKYADGTDINISADIENNNVVFKVRDYGKGFYNEDIPFVFNKFYRGKNSSESEGAGLGLYIVKYVIGQMDGEVTVGNTSPGAEIKIILPICES